MAKATLHKLPIEDMECEECGGVVKVGDVTRYTPAYIDYPCVKNWNTDYLILPKECKYLEDD